MRDQARGLASSGTVVPESGLQESGEPGIKSASLVLGMKEGKS